MNHNLQLEIVTPFGKTLTEEILSCVVPGVKGQFQVLKNHAPVISNISVGAIKVKNGEKSEIFIATSGGFCEVRDNTVKIVVESAEISDSIDVDRALKAKERAEDRLKSKAGEFDEVRAKLALARAINRISVSKYAS
jgi:F-type H+-transporting ATPase subunit epsilon